MNPDQDQQPAGPSAQPSNADGNQPGGYIMPARRLEIQPLATDAPPAAPVEPVQPSVPVQPQPVQPPTPLVQPAQLPVLPADNTPYVNPFAPQTPVYGYTNQTQPLPQTGKGRGPLKKKLVITAAAGVGVVLLVSGVVFGYYLPNRPNNVYSSGLNRTGDILDKMVVEATDEKKLEKYGSSEFSGSFEFNGPGEEKYSGTISSKYDPTSSDSSFGYKGGAADVNVQLLSDAGEGEIYPDIFFKVGGLNTLGVDQMMPEVMQYNDKWIGITGEYLKKLIPEEEFKDAKKNEVTNKDAVELGRRISSTTNEYLFSTDPEKAVMIQKSFVGTEKMDGGITANHYVVAIHKENSAKYCKALTDAVMTSEAYKKFSEMTDEEHNEEKKRSHESCDDGTKDIDDEDVFDMWVDKKRKLIHKIRISDEEDKGTYFEIGQTYTKGDVIPMFLAYHSDKEKIDGRLTLEVDVEKSVTKGTMTFKLEGDEPYSGEAKFEFKPHDGEVKIEPPKDAIPIEQVLSAFGLSGEDFASSYSDSDLTTRAEDSESETDIKAMHGQLEAYYAQYAYYPTLAQFNDASWRRSNMNSLDSEALKTPSGSVSTLAANASAAQYGYATTECDREGCQQYELKAVLTDGGVYIKTALN